MFPSLHSILCSFSWQFYSSVHEIEESAFVLLNILIQFPYKLIVYGIQRGSRSDYFMTGIGIGLSSYTELAGLQIVTSGSLIDRSAENDGHSEIGTGSICDLM
jgi:hypothetical protein